jgi:hypothetical protein
MWFESERQETRAEAPRREGLLLSYNPEDFPIAEPAARAQRAHEACLPARPAPAMASMILPRPACDRLKLKIEN